MLGDIAPGDVIPRDSDPLKDVVAGMGLGSPGGIEEDKIEALDGLRAGEAERDVFMILVAELSECSALAILLSGGSCSGSGDAGHCPEDTGTSDSESAVRSITVLGVTESFPCFPEFICL